MIHLPIEILKIIGEYGGIDLKIALKIKPSRIRLNEFEAIINLKKPSIDHVFIDTFSYIQLKINGIKKIILRYNHFKDIRQILINISQYRWKIYYLDHFYDLHFSVIPLIRPIWYHEFKNKYFLTK